jgi:hypothetical protein
MFKHTVLWALGLAASVAFTSGNLAAASPSTARPITVKHALRADHPIIISGGFRADHPIIISGGFRADHPIIISGGFSPTY